MTQCEALILPKRKNGPYMNSLERKGLMKKKRLEVEDGGDGHGLEILKAVAQAWHGHSGTSLPTNEFDAHRLNFKSKPSRFKLEAIIKSRTSAKEICRANWDFGQSLWDSYEIVTVSKRIETGLVLGLHFEELDETIQSDKRHKESKNSLRNLFNRKSSRRFSDDHFNEEDSKL